MLIFDNYSNSDNLVTMHMDGVSLLNHSGLETYNYFNIVKV